jgi:Rrf2 family nitric oxide-sensitive transcriptional repressor
MLSQTAEYALRAVVALASGRPEKASGRNEPRTVQDLSQESQVPLDYLSKVMNSLSRAGIVAGQRGRGGGFQTVLPATELTVLQVVTAVDPLKRIHKCPLGLEAHLDKLCPLHRKLDDAVKSVEDAFASTTIASVCEGTREDCDALV